MSQFLPDPMFKLWNVLGTYFTSSIVHLPFPSSTLHAGHSGPAIGVKRQASERKGKNAALVGCSPSLTPSSISGMCSTWFLRSVGAQWGGGGGGGGAMPADLVSSSSSNSSIISAGGSEIYSGKDYRLPKDNSAYAVLHNQ